MPFLAFSLIQNDVPNKQHYPRTTRIALADLTDREERILRLRFGLDDDILRTYKDRLLIVF